MKPLGFLLSLCALVTTAAAQPDTNAPSGPPAATAAVPTTVDAALPTGRAAARQAQRLMRRGDYAGAAEAYLRAARDAGGPLNRHCRYNAAAALYRAGRYSEAAALLSDLLHAGGDANPDTAMGLGSAVYEAAEHAAATNAAGVRLKATRLKDAGEAFKEAARLDAETPTAAQNLAVILNRLPEAREQAAIAELMEKHGGTPPPQLAEQALNEQRALLDAIAPAFTNEAPRRIADLEALSRRQTANAYLLIPLKAGLLSALQNQQGQPGAQQSVEQILESTRDSMRDSARRLRDLDPQSRDAAAVSEAGLYHIWKAVAAYPALLREDMLRQTNAITATLAAPADRQAPAVEKEQTEAVSLTELFTQRFSEQVPKEGLPAQTPAMPPGTGPEADAAAAPTNAAPGGISAETRQEIVDLATAAAEAQRAALDLSRTDKRPESLERQRRAHELLKEIEKRLPKDKSSSQQQQQQQDSQDPSQQQEPKPEDKPPEQQPPQEQPETPPPEPEEKPQEEQPQPQPSETDQQEMSQEDLQRLLDKALQREQDYREEKRRREQTIPMSPRERDW
jgi:hypothetical protein